jgi:hypothetical protein
MQNVCKQAYLYAADMALLVALSALSIASPGTRTVTLEPSLLLANVNSTSTTTANNTPPLALCRSVTDRLMHFGKMHKPSPAMSGASAL